ncbi:3-deoxy-manno-octulosonate cytidylyltransferase [Fulvitalea axinellae]|uniref:3-deoxy-manno-octulosonate cytidylyltransferase n=1 Tax=Fulvitalea axinellae TaxID=1182444 RepID=A0AAU9CRQ7_9BACT|nr:3-deoxy-manno-octulosonate cytidylyltransferase [Fulvitalea axinellae]
MSNKTVVVIPARLLSSRLPRKVILDLAGKPVVQWVYEKAMRAQGVDAVYIATDSEEVAQVCREFTDNVIMTRADHQSGTDRIAEAAEHIDADVVINVQGDEPLIDPEIISELANSFEGSDQSMGSVMTPLHDAHEVLNPNVVKVVTDRNGYALYFSRSPIPYARDAFETLREGVIPEGFQYHKHLGIYGYRKDFLLDYNKMEPTSLETSEKLEQLRALQNGHRIRMIETDYDCVGIDTAEDLEKARKLALETDNFATENR